MSKGIERLSQIGAEIIALNKERSKLDAECRKQSRDKINSIPAEYAYKICDPSVRDKDDSFRILRTLANYQIYQDIIAEYGHPTFTGFEDKETVLSVSYVYRGGLVTHEGGGHLILTDPFICDDAEWELLKEGDLPTIEKYL